MFVVAIQPFFFVNIILRVSIKGRLLCWLVLVLRCPMARQEKASVDCGFWLFLNCLAGAWKQWVQERTGVRERDMRGEREHVSLLCAPSFFQAPAMQARLFLALCPVFYRQKQKRLKVRQLLGCIQSLFQKNQEKFCSCEY